MSTAQDGLRVTEALTDCDVVVDTGGGVGEKELPMKVSMVGATLLAVLIGALATAAGAGGVSAQANVCQSNPSPVDAADPSIIVTAPATNAAVTSPIHVTGQARVFEAAVSLTLFDAAGDEIVSTTTMAAEGQTLSPFSTDVAFSVTSDTPACLWVFESSAQDGSPINVVQIPISLRPAGGLPETGSGGSTAPASVVWLVAALAITGAGLIGASALAHRRSR
jgi:hypothetical protein